MKVKTIKSVIAKKLNEWLESITDPSVKELAKQNTIVTGGCIASMLLKEEVNDFDLYFRTREATLAVAVYYVDRFNANRNGDDKAKVDTRLEDRVTIYVKSNGVTGDMPDAPYDEDAKVAAEPEASKEDKEEAKKYKPIFLSTNAITLSGKLQIVCRFSGEPDAIHENYDFVHCMNYYTAWDSQLVLRPKALEALLSRELVYIGSKYPVCSLIRTRKFIKRGWTINAGQYVKMAYQVSHLDLDDIEVLKDQLTGVDSAYFEQVIRLLAESGSERVDGTYLFELIDRIF